ncbi:MAG: hypothetical protein QXV81_03620 [Ignisphaera sp.]
MARIELVRCSIIKYRRGATSSIRWEETRRRSNISTEKKSIH